MMQRLAFDRPAQRIALRLDLIAQRPGGLAGVAVEELFFQAQTKEQSMQGRHDKLAGYLGKIDIGRTALRATNSLLKDMLSGIPLLQSLPGWLQLIFLDLDFHTCESLSHPVFLSPAFIMDRGMETGLLKAIDHRLGVVPVVKCS